MNMEFSLTEEQSIKAIQFKTKHYESCAKNGVGAIGGSITYFFTSTGLGIVEKIKCNICNEELDLTNYDSW